MWSSNCGAGFWRSEYDECGDDEWLEVRARGTGVPFILRVLWFLLIGWHVTLWWVLAAWFLVITIIGMPLGL